MDPYAKSSLHCVLFERALVEVICAGVESESDFDLQHLPKSFIATISEPLLPLIQWRLDAVTSPGKEEERKILRWIRQRLDNVMKECVNDEVKCEFTEDAVEKEVSKLLEYPGPMTFLRILQEHDEDPEYQNARELMEADYVKERSTSQEDESFVVFNHFPPLIIKKPEEQEVKEEEK